MTPATAERRRWMGVLARAPDDALERAWTDLDAPPVYEFLRRPEIGLMMMRARAGGTGLRFNVGEITVTRCAVRTPDGRVGHAWVQGRALRKAERAAVFDALLQDPARREALLAGVVEPLARAQADARDAAARKAAATRVEFFTLVRGDNPT